MSNWMNSQELVSWLLDQRPESSMEPDEMLSERETLAAGADLDLLPQEYEEWKDMGSRGSQAYESPRVFNDEAPSPVACVDQGQGDLAGFDPWLDAEEMDEWITRTMQGTGQLAEIAQPEARPLSPRQRTGTGQGEILDGPRRSRLPSEADHDSDMSCPPELFKSRSLAGSEHSALHKSSAEPPRLSRVLSDSLLMENRKESLSVSTGSRSPAGSPKRRPSKLKPLGLSRGPSDPVAAPGRQATVDDLCRTRLDLQVRPDPTSPRPSQAPPVGWEASAIPAHPPRLAPSDPRPMSPREHREDSQITLDTSTGAHSGSSGSNGSNSSGGFGSVYSSLDIAVPEDQEMTALSLRDQKKDSDASDGATGDSSRGHESNSFSCSNDESPPSSSAPVSAPRYEDFQKSKIVRSASARAAVPRHDQGRVFEVQNTITPARRSPPPLIDRPSPSPSSASSSVASFGVRLTKAIGSSGPSPLASLWGKINLFGDDTDPEESEPTSEFTTLDLRVSSTSSMNSDDGLFNPPPDGETDGRKVSGSAVTWSGAGSTLRPPGPADCRGSSTTAAESITVPVLTATTAAGGHLPGHQ
jgi:hypothetical protein